MDKSFTRPVIFEFNSNVKEGWIYIEVDQSFHLNIFEEVISGIPGLQILNRQTSYASHGTLQSMVEITTNLGEITIEYHLRALPLDSAEERVWGGIDLGYHISADLGLMDMILPQLNRSNYFMDKTLASINGDNSKNKECTETLNTPFVSLKLTFESLLSAYQTPPGQIKKFWKEISTHYNQPQRCYHTLTHLRHLFGILDAYKLQLADWEAVQFAIFYHDIVYDVTRQDNEEQSAAWAEQVMQSLPLAPHRIKRCKDHILATSGHSISNDPDTNFFIDADLSILGSNWETYETYGRHIRQEFKVYGDDVYKNGRKAVLEKFLQRGTIYKTEPFVLLYEEQARKNMIRELQILDE
jgi:predicted metal-dependent HD superfamily phosphohydrolase